MGAIVWLASYPKSGNTWVRAFLTNYTRDGSEPADINDLEGALIASARWIFDEVVGVEASDLTASEIARYRPDVYRRLASESDAPVFVKAHDAFRTRNANAALFPAPVTAHAIYIIRNPLDVAVSLAHHHGVSIDQAVCRMCREHTLAHCDGRLKEQLEQVLLTWSDHVRSWVAESGLRVHLTRYEDMVRDPQPAFEAITEAAGLELDVDRVTRAIEFSRFEILRAQEQEKGFKERPRRAAEFFRKGQIGDWRNALTVEHVHRLLDAHGETMRRFGYLTDSGEPLF